MDLIQYKCPDCGGELKFDPSKGAFCCEYCRGRFSRQDMDRQTENKEKQAGSQGTPVAVKKEEEEGRVYTCPSCGATIITDSTTAATFCYYCHNPVVLSGRLEGDQKPDHIIPFRIDRKKALEIFEQWLSRKKYVPDEFYSKDQIEKFSGVYFPYYLYSCNIEGRVEGEARRKKTGISGNIEETSTEIFHVVREGTLPVKYIVKNALNKANRKLAEHVLPFDISGIKPFSMSYLSGFMAEKRDIEKEKYGNTVESDAKAYALSRIRESAGGYDEFTVTSDTTAVRDAKWEYAMMPVWTLTYNDSGKIYYFSVNGQTGKTVGELPIDGRKLRKTFLKIFIILGLALSLIAFLIFGL